MGRIRTYYRCLGERPNGTMDYKVYQNPKDVKDWVESHDFINTAFTILVKQDRNVKSVLEITYQDIVARVGKIGFQPKGE